MVRCDRRRRFLAALCLIGWSVVPAAAQEPTAAADPVTLAAPSLLAAAHELPIRPDVQAPNQSAPSAKPQAPKRPAALVPMYISFAGLQALDIHSTHRALKNPSAREANPVARAVVGNQAAFTAAKLGATAGFVLASEKMWKKHPLAAVLFNIAGNSALAAVVAHNYRVARQ
jgi:hypothetical protein